jgi:hypothetical protein
VYTTLYIIVSKIASRNSADSAGEKKYHLQSLRGGRSPPRNDMALGVAY